MDGSTSIGTASLNGGVATLTTTGLGLGARSISATYSDDAGFDGSTSPSVVVTITPTTLTAPRAPTSVSATAGNAKVSVSWSVPSSNSGTSITGYTVTTSPGSAICTTSSTSCTVTGLHNGTSYTFTVTATNSVGTGIASAASNAVTPSAPRPPAPKIVITSKGVVLAGKAPDGSGATDL